MTDEATYQRLYADYCERGRQLDAARAELSTAAQDRLQLVEMLDAARAENQALKKRLWECREEMVRLALMMGKPARPMIDTLLKRIDAALREG